VTNYQAISSLVSRLAIIPGDGGRPLFSACYDDDPDLEIAFARDYPRARVRPTFWTESDTVLPGKVVVILEFEVELTTCRTRAVGELPQSIVDPLIAAVRAALTGYDLGAGCLPALTRVKSGKYVPWGLGTRRLDQSDTGSLDERRVWFVGQCGITP
jgi:hypothetical protein